MQLPRTSAGMLGSAAVDAPGSHPFSPHADYERDFRLLHARPGCRLDELKRAHRVAVRSLHPDANPDLAQDAGAQLRLTELNAAWRRLADYHRVHGRLPFAPDATTADRLHQDPAIADLDRPTHGARAVMAFVALVLAGASFAWFTTRPELPAGDASTASIESTATAHTAEAPASGFASRANADAGAVRRVRIGDRKARVREILGPPILQLDGNWEYGPSYVKFKDGRAVDWYSSPLNPIAVDEASRDDARDDATTHE